MLLFFLLDLIINFVRYGLAVDVDDVVFAILSAAQAHRLVGLLLIVFYFYVRQVSFRNVFHPFPEQVVHVLEQHFEILHHRAIAVVPNTQECGETLVVNFTAVLAYLGAHIDAILADDVLFNQRNGFGTFTRAIVSFQLNFLVQLVLLAHLRDFHLGVELVGFLELGDLGELLLYFVVFGLFGL